MAAPELLALTDLTGDADKVAANASGLDKLRNRRDAALAGLSLTGTAQAGVQS